MCYDVGAASSGAPSSLFETRVHRDLHKRTHYSKLIPTAKCRNKATVDSVPPREMTKQSQIVLVNTKGSQNEARVTLEIIGVDHIYLTVSDLKQSEAFYDSLMRVFGFKKGTAPIGGEPHCHYYNRELAISIRPAHAGTATHDPYAPGLHHICFRVADNASVDAAATILDSLSIAKEGPRLWPAYAPDYYAVFFHDRDGIRLEVMNFREGRKQIRANWDTLK